MRYLLTILAVLVILVFSAALAVPYFVNWDDQRVLVSARISQLLGVPVKINGPIDLKLLPTPYLMLGAVEISDPTGKSAASVAEIRLEIALAPLLHGDIDFIEAQLMRPKLRLDLVGDTVGLKLPNLAGDMKFDRFTVQDGEITVRDPAAERNYSLAGLDLEAEAPSLEGPFKGEGRVRQNGHATSFRFSTAAVENNRLRFKLVIDEGESQRHDDLDASLTFDPRGLAAGLPVLDGQLTVSGQTESPVAMPWHLGGTLHAELRQATLADFSLRLGDEDHAVDIPGAAEFDLGPTPKARISLKAKQVNLDRLLAEKAAPPAPRRLEAALRDAIAKTGPPPFPVTLSWNFDTVSLGNETFGDVSGALGLTKTGGTTLRLAGEGPGRSRVQLDGKVETGSAPAFDGHIDAATDDFPRLKDWLAANLPDLDTAGIAPFRSFAIAGKANVSAVGFFGNDFRLRLDRSTLTGSLAYTRTVGNDPPRLYADLSAPALDLDHLPDIRAAFDPANRMDLSLRLDSHAIKVADFRQGPIDAGRIVLKLTKAGSLTTLEKLDVAGLGGMNLSATGRFDGKSGQIQTKLDAAGLADAATLVRRLFPGPAAELFATHAAPLAPAHLDLSAEIQRTEADRLMLSAFNLKGALAQTSLAAKLTPDARDRTRLAFAGHLDAPETSALFRQLGFAALPLKGFGGGQIDLAAQGEFGKPLTTQVSATLAGAKLDFHGTLEPDLIAPKAAGTVKLTSSDLSGLMQMTAVAFPDLTGRIPADLSSEAEWQGNRLSLHKLSGSLDAAPIAADLTYAANDKRLSGSVELASMSLANILAMALGPAQPAKPGQAWSDAGFTSGLIDAPTANLSIKAKNFALWPGIVGHDAKLDFDVSSDRAGPKLGLRLVHMKLGLGSAAGDLALRRDSAAASLEGHMSVRDYGFSLPSAAGDLSADFEFASTGTSATALIAGLAGGGTVQFTDLALPRSDPRALARVFKAVEQDELGIDEGEISRALTREFERQPLILPRAEFDAGLAGGILRLSPKADAAPASPAPDQAITSTQQASIDLRSLSIDQRTLLSLGSLPKDWKGAPPQVGLNAKGPLANPARQIEIAAFINAVAARAIARESARIEQQEFDQHERIFFYQRLLSERRREQERLRAEEQARRAAELAASIANSEQDDHKEDVRPDVPLPPVNEQRRAPRPPMRALVPRVPNAATDPAPQLPMELHSPGTQP